jgi:peptidase M16-like protein
MQAFKRQFVSALLVVLCLLSAQQVRAELVTTTGDTKFASLIPLRNGISAITLVWPIDPLTKDRANALIAGLSSVVSGGTSSRSAYEIDAFLNIKGIEQNVSTNGRNLLLTVSAPDEVFPETLTHLENLLLEPEYSRGWYARELQKIRLKNSSNTGRPSDVLNEVAYTLMYEPNDETVDGSDGEFRFGRPSQAILRSGDQKNKSLAIRLVNELPKAKWEFRIAKWATALTGVEERSFDLPVGTIHFADLDSTEMLILFVKAEEFKDEGDQVGANLLMDYIGDNSGSEMFRIIRQEMRAAYDPRSDFVVMNKNRSIISLRATVEAEKWPEVHGTMREIYENTRAGKIDRAGLEIQQDRLKRSYSSLLFSNPVWGAQHYLNEYPAGADGTISLPIFEALETVSLDKVVANSEAHLPPLEDFLLILIGGGIAPTEALKSNGYCALPKNTPLNYCLDVLSNTLN